MDTYSVWQDVLDTYQSLSDVLKFAWLIVPPTFVIVLVAVCFHYQLARSRLQNDVAGKGILKLDRDTVEIWEASADRSRSNTSTVLSKSVTAPVLTNQHLPPPVPVRGVMPTQHQS
jgi:hypothetical protein